MILIGQFLLCSYLHRLFFHIFIGYASLMSPVISGSFAERNLHLIHLSHPVQLHLVFMCMNPYGNSCVHIYMYANICIYIHVIYKYAYICIYIHVFARLYLHDTHKGGNASDTPKGVGKGEGTNPRNRYVIALKTCYIYICTHDFIN